MPVLEIDGNGVLYAQSNAINRYISKKYGKAINVLSDKNIDIF